MACQTTLNDASLNWSREREKERKREREREREREIVALCSRIA